MLSDTGRGREIPGGRMEVGRWLVDFSREDVGPRCLDVPDGGEGDPEGEGKGEQVTVSSRENVGPRCLEIPTGEGRRHRGVRG